MVQTFVIMCSSFQLVGFLTVFIEIIVHRLTFHSYHTGCVIFLIFSRIINKYQYGLQQYLKLNVNNHFNSIVLDINTQHTQELPENLFKTLIGSVLSVFTQVF